MTQHEAGREALGVILEGAEQQLWVDFQQAGSFENTGTIGSGREQTLIDFLNRSMPKRFSAARGEIVDLGGARSGQVDVLIYDSTFTAPLLTNQDGNVIIGAEALLATVEVKSTLTKVR